MLPKINQNIYKYNKLSLIDVDEHRRQLLPIKSLIMN